MFIKFLEDRGAHKKGQLVDYTDEAKAATLIELGIAEKSEAPKEDNFGETLKTVMSQVLDDKLKGVGKANGNPDAPDKHPEQPKKFTVPAEAKRYGTLRNFKGADAHERAYRFGMWCLSNYALNGKIQDPERQESMTRLVKRAKGMGIPIVRSKDLDDDAPVVNKGGNLDAAVGKASNENNNISSGFLVPDEFQNDLIDLREKFGVFRQHAKIVPMSSDTRSDPRRRSGVQAYFVGEDQAGTQAVKNWDRVRLTAKKLMILTKYSNELNEDSVMNLADDLAEEIGYSFAYTEDKCGFVGDGTSTYGGIVGATTALKNVSTTGAYADVLGIVIGSGTGFTGGSYGGLLLSDFNKVVGTLPEYADDDARWYVHKTFWGSVMQKLATAAGGNRVGEITGGARVKEFLGYEVVISQVMPKTAAGFQVCALFGSLRRAASLGDRRITTISISDVALNSFEQDEIAIRGTERFDINVHDVGENANGTARDPIQGVLPGPLVGLLTPNA